ncbi:MAG: NAD(P)-dependent alcohol dehydrogenase [Nitrosopumilus sp.]|nr:NAD(P)-dependent alcohol dehydrogenase [Nitrosopumilus sp.]
MKAVICTKYGPPEVLQIREVAKPIPNDNQILIKIIATAVNSGDVRVRSLNVKGLMKVIMRIFLGVSKPRIPILGTVFSGVVIELGNKVSKFQIGEKVFGMTGFKFGTYAEFVAVNQNSNVIEMPKNATYEEAAALVFGGQTAIYFLNKAKISDKSRPKVLIIGATGSVGTAAIQIAQHQNADVTAVCSSKGLELVKGLGVKNIILYDKEDFTKQIEKFDIIFDAIGKTTRKECKPLLKETGVYKSVNGSGTASETLPQLQLLKELFEKGKYKAVIDKTFPMDKIVEAHRYVDTERKKGNVVLTISIGKECMW